MRETPMADTKPHDRADRSRSFVALPISWLPLVFAMAAAASAMAQATSASDQTTPGDMSTVAAASPTTYVTVSLEPSHTAISTTGNPGRVDQYEDIQSSFGGSFGLDLTRPADGLKWTSGGEIRTKDDYHFDSTLHWGQLVTLTVDSRSFVHHPDKLLYGTNLSDDIIVSDTLAPTQVNTLLRTMTRLDFKVRLPSTPLTVFFKLNNTAQRGDVPSRYFDMSSTPTCGENCHLASGRRTINYTNQTRGFGAEYRTKDLSVTYEHDQSLSGSHRPQPLDYFGAVTAIPDDPLPAGVPNTAPGYYEHDILASHHVTSDTASLFARLVDKATLNAGVTKGRNEDTTTGNSASVLSANAAFRVTFSPRWYGNLSYRQDYFLNDFTPEPYTLFPNASVRRLEGALRLGYRLSPSWDLEAYVKEGEVRRSESDLFPQFYSPDNADPLHVVPRTLTNTAGLSAVHRGAPWEVRSGYEWARTRDPGYVTTPGLANRLYLDVSWMPSGRVSMTNDASMIWQRQFPGVDRRGNLFDDTLSFSINPVTSWTTTLALAYQEDALRTDLTYGTDPVYTESLVPYDATAKSASLTSRLQVTDRLRWSLSGNYTSSRSEFRPSEPNDFLPIVAWASAFSRVDIPTEGAQTEVSWTWPGDLTTAIQGRFTRYRDEVHPELSGIDRAVSVFVRKRW